MHTSDKVQGFYFLSYQLMVLKFIADLLFILKAYLLFRFNGISWLISIARESESPSPERASHLRPRERVTFARESESPSLFQLSQKNINI